MPITLPPVLTAPIAHDAIDNEVAANRGHLIALATFANGLETRVAAVEARTPGGSTPVVTVPITQAQQDALAAVITGGVAILRGPTLDILLQRV